MVTDKIGQEKNGSEHIEHSEHSEHENINQSILYYILPITLW
jgi:hypothetical protein